MKMISPTLRSGGEEDVSYGCRGYDGIDPWHCIPGATAPILACTARCQC